MVSAVRWWPILMSLMHGFCTAVVLPQDLGDTRRRAQELRHEVAQNRKELRQRMQVLMRVLAELRTKRQK